MHVFTAPPKKRVVIVINPKSESSNTFQQCTYAMERSGFFMHRKNGPDVLAKVATTRYVHLQFSPTTPHSTDESVKTWKAIMGFVWKDNLVFFFFWWWNVMAWSMAFRPRNRVPLLPNWEHESTCMGFNHNSKVQVPEPHISWRGWQRHRRSMFKVIEGPPLSRSFYGGEEEDFTLLVALASPIHRVTRVPSLRVLSSLLNPRSRLTIVWPNCFLDANFGLDSSTFIVYLGKEIKPIRTLNPNCYRGLFWSWYTWMNENLN
jgi:hypothetical protein